MGIYLNSEKAYALYKSETLKPYFVDKTVMLEELCPLVQEGSNYVCITRPRRFGKTVMANMIGAFFSKEKDSSDLFDHLQISKNQVIYEKNRNHYQVIQISLNEMPRKCDHYDQYIARIEKRVINDLKKAYPQVSIDEEEALWDVFTDIFSYDNSAKFVFILDEWDFIFHRDFVTEEDKKSYISFLSNLLKDQPYVSLAYMTGILPIAKYSSGSELNMFSEYTMASQVKYAEYFGFTEQEVDELYQRYSNQNKDKHVTREGLQFWYNGYHTLSGERLYNPRSVVLALTNNNLGNYWTSAGPYDEIYYYIQHNIADIRDGLAKMISGIAVPAKIQEYAATSTRLKTKDEIYSAMVVYGFLSYEDGNIMIPNQELMDRFVDMLHKEPSLGYLNQLAEKSEKMLKATLDGNTQTMTEILEFAHDTEIPLLDYNNESELNALINLLYLSARDQYRVERENKAGRGYVDFIFYPEMDKNADCIILELKVNDTAEHAIEQIVNRKYAIRFQGSLGEKKKYTGRILAVGIAYDKDTKKHECKIEEIK